MAKSKSDAPAIVFVATVYKVQTLVDNGLRVTFDLSEGDIMQAAQLMECKREGIPLLCTCKATTV